MLPALIPLLIVLPLMILPLWRLYTKTDSSAVQFKDVEHLLTVTNARLKYDKPPVREGVAVHYYRQHAWLYGTINNDSDHRWDNLEFLLEFQNADGDRLDVNNVSASITSQPHSSLEIRLACELAIDPKDVSKTKVTVTDASLPYR